MMVMTILKRIYPKANAAAVVVLMAVVGALDVMSSHYPEMFYQDLTFVRSALELQTTAAGFLWLSIFFVYDHRIMIFVLAPIYFF